jgi:hypothetical protein
MLLLGCWLHQCTGSEALLARLHARMKQAYLPGWAGRDLAADKVRPMQINKPDGRILQGKTRYWSPWQESLAATGFFALWRHTGDEVAEQLAAAIATTVLRHGWRVGPRGAQVGYALRWNEDGSPLTAAQLAGDDPTVCTWAGGGIAAWSIGAVEVARYFATRDGDQTAWHRAEQILQLLRQVNTRPPRDGWWDAFREWDAVR